MTDNDFCFPRVGLGLLLVKDNCEILLGKRISSHGAGEYAGVGGHLEHGESFEKCILREMREEIGDDIKISDLRHLYTSNILDYLPKHYVDIGMIAKYDSGKALVMEPDKVQSWDWYSVDDLPSPLFGSVPKYIEAFNKGL